ncbi:alpha-xenorhabdolysin family binary toxin subunit A [Nostoc sp. CENA67]|uniref:Alpha-xenorhabdolysin family binary toxin subunit A n=1 Tax=Amazonocrinis nigriterrae CENA67 TaxID=2794033 RepID=A0A8J7HTY8_9NOST|nr:alpha-xenorhabdolysin family binary toxin subunit A [Amazonocrinis nigriterrae]MBH8565888.1 alpha-xenorhabdolysin family binary toxin subunit A [Amazonocrinis nigriterrae CENA67]
MQELYEQIVQKAREIEQLQRDYEHFKGLAFSGLVGGPIGLAITQGIYSSKAEEARRRMNQLIVEKDILNQQLNEKDQLRRSVERVSDKLALVSITLLDSESASDDLQVVWDNIYYQIETSANTLANIKEGTKLMTFKTQFLKVINPWENAKDSIIQLVNLISQVLESYDEGAGITQFGVPN